MRPIKPIFILVLVVFFSTCSQNRNAEDSIYNFQNYSLNTTSYINAPSDESRIYLREWTAHDVIIRPKVMYIDDINRFGYDVFLVPQVYTYSGDCKIHPNIQNDAFVYVTSLGEVFTYKVFENPEIFKSYQLVYSTAESTKYGPYARINLPTKQYGVIKDVLITPLAAKFIEEHDYQNKSKLVLITFAQDAILGDGPINRLRPILSPSSVHGILCIADSETAIIINEIPEKLLWDSRGYMRYFSRYE